MLTLSRRGGVWHFRLRLANGLDVRKSTGQSDKAAAELAALRIVAGMDLDGMAKHRAKAAELAPLVDRFKEWAKTRHTRQTLRRDMLALSILSEYTGGTLPEDLDAEKFMQWRLAAKVSPACVNVDVRHIRAALGAMARLGWIPCNPFAKVKLL
ncbi:MAG: hypothetical protein H3C30_16750, partial [Candidatus Hydrogenedentes bacterium]|nr:hypothetical protein [Candidatus Hydrogenedentota bacterium]